MGDYYVYRHTSPSGKVYIGMTGQHPNDRWQLGLGYRTQKKFYRAIQKYGWENFKHEILFENLTFEEAEEKEVALISEHRSCDNRFGYNVERGGNAHKGMSEETRAKLSEINRSPEALARIKALNEKRWSDPEEHEKMRQRFLGEKNPMYGKKHSLENRLKQSERLREEYAAGTRKVVRLCGSDAPFYGKKHTEESKQKIAETRRGDKNWRARRVLCVETGAVYSCIRDAYRETGVRYDSISSCCRGINKQAGGFHWRYVDDREGSDSE